MSYSYLWAENRESILQEFCDKEPLIVEISEKFKEFDDRAEEIKQLPDVHNIGAVQITLGWLQ